MKTLFLSLFLASMTIAGVNAQDKDIRDYKQQQKQELQETIRSQKEHYKAEAAKTMQAKKREVQADLQARREQLTHRPAGMVAYKGN